MPKLLNPRQIEQFHEDGCIHPIRAISEADAFVLRSKLESFEWNSGWPLGGAPRHTYPLLFPWLAALEREKHAAWAIGILCGSDMIV